ncbi:hypothetical protein B0H14DRAFT_3776843 [Mycena olivaceomarginata]|nr:hypothetical protein B0H14DRAFT_3776843 [Mycena olivaceomarginata]
MVCKNVDAIIENKLYLGNLVAARSTRSLSERRITHVFSVCADPIPAELPESGIRHMRIPVEDVDYADLLIHLPSACQFIDHAIRSGGRIWFTMSRQIWPNAGFQEQLVLFELCQYQPSPSWRYKLDRQLRAAGLKR